MASVIKVDIAAGDDTLSPALDRATRKFDDVDKGAQKASTSLSKVTNVTLQFAQAGLGAAQALGQMDGQAGILAQGLLNLATSGNIVNAVLSVLDTVVKLVTFRLKEAQEELKKLAEVGKFETRIQNQIALLQAVNPEIEAVGGKNGAFGEEGPKIDKATPQTFGLLDKAQALEIAAIQKRLADERTKQLKAEQAELEGLRQSLVNMIEQQRIQIKAFEEGDAAAEDYRLSILESSVAVQ